jgi:hypothetical protein
MGYSFMQRYCVYTYTCQAGAHVKLLHSKIEKIPVFQTWLQLFSEIGKLGSQHL